VYKTVKKGNDRGMGASTGLRGSTLEELINLTNEAYRRKGLAVIQKVPTPITPVQFDGTSRTITLAYFDQKSTVDYIGAVQGVPVCFDAKETTLKSLPIQNVHEHQIEFMCEFEKQEGLAFLLVHFRHVDEYYYLPLGTLLEFWNAAKSGGRKSIPYDAFDKTLQIRNDGGCYIHYLEALSTILSRGE